MKRYVFTNDCGRFAIEELSNGTFIVRGNIKAAEIEFRKINRRPPNEYGNFYGREKAGFAACRELIATLSNEVK